MNKTNVRIAAIHSTVTAADVARVSRDRRRVTLRHCWVDEDGRAVHAVMAAARALAREIADASGHDVAVIDRDGSTLDVVYAD